MREFTAAEQDEIRRQERNMLEKFDRQPTRRRQFMEQAEARCRRTKLARKAKVPGVGIFFVVNAKPWLHWIPWTENPSYAGYRTYGVGHPEYWKLLLDADKVPLDMPYDEAARGRVNYHEASGRFTLFADRCIIKSKPQIRAIMIALNLPRGTTVLADDHYQCLKCMRRRAPRLALDQEWDY
jgi:hypothetical protein